MTGPDPRTVDAHVHVWRTAPGRYRWLEQAPPALRRTFGADEAGRALAESGAGRAVLVQAEDSAEDTAAMLRAAAERPWVAGVVGWVPLDDPERAEEQLATVGRSLVGVRHLVHDDPRADFLELPAVHRSLRSVAALGLAFDVPDAWPVHLAQLGPLADTHPDLTVVLDHLGKPPVDGGEVVRWARAVADLARRPNVVAKVSGLQHPDRRLSLALLRPVLDTAVEAFGPDRLLYGSDWPMTVPTAEPGAHRDAVRAWAAELSDGERESLFHGTAERVYGLPASSES